MKTRPKQSPDQGRVTVESFTLIQRVRDLIRALRPVISARAALSAKVITESKNGLESYIPISP